MMDCRILLLLLIAAVFDASGRKSSFVSRALNGRRDPETVACTSSSRPESLTAMTGTFGSPNYPENYTSIEWCEWSISYTAPNHDGRVLISFPFLKTELVYDYVEIFDGYDGFGGQLARYSGNAAVRSVTSTLPGLLVRFVADGSVQDIGFEAGWTADPACYSGEHGALSGTGAFNSPYYPGRFSGDLNCDWKVGAPNEVGEVHFDAFNVGTVTEGTHCSDAHLYYSDSTGTETYFCGQTIPANISFTGEAHFHFVSPYGYVVPEGAGFLAHYDTRAAS